MPPVPAATLAAIRAGNPMHRYLELRGVELHRQGQDWVCRCPLPDHDDRTPSFHITVMEDGEVGHCFGCDWAGNIFQLLQRAERCDFLAAVATAAALVHVPFDEQRYRTPGRRKAAPESCPLDPEADDGAVSLQVIAFYHSRLLRAGSAGWRYLEQRGLADRGLVERYRLGFAERGALGRLLPSKQVAAGAQLRDKLERLDWFKAQSGHETFAGRVVVPVLDVDGSVQGCYGRAVGKLRDPRKNHWNSKGGMGCIWNAAAFAPDGAAATAGTVITCEAPLDALTFARWGRHDVTATLGCNNAHAQHVAAYRAAGIQTVYVAYDGDRSGDDGAESFVGRLLHAGMTVYRVQYPASADANSVAVAAGAEAGAVLGQLLRDAVWVGGAAAVADLSIKPANTTDLSLAASPVSSSSVTPAQPAQDVARAESGCSGRNVQALARGLPADVAVRADGDDIRVMVQRARRYRLRGLDRNAGDHTLKLTLSVWTDEDAGYTDQLDLYQGRQRAAFVKNAGAELGRAVDVLQRDLGFILQVCENWQAERAKARAQAVADLHTPVDAAAAMTAEDRAAAEALLRDPAVLRRVVDDLTAWGLVGETVNKCGCYLATTSRLLDRPLAVLVQSSSAAGKTTLMDAVLALMPEEARKRASAISEMALYYEPTGLQHKILAIAEEEGAQSASYSLKLLQSDGSLVFDRPVKNPDTGELVTKSYQVDGPVQLMLTTTKTLVDDELANRCLVLTVGEDAAQTGGIHDRQRLAQSWAGQEARAQRRAIQQLHQNAQRLLRPLVVVNPFAEHLRFTTARVRARRDHQKYLDLIASVTLLHQFQRERETRVIGGQRVEAVVVAAEDIAIANELAHVLLGQSLDELSGPGRQFLRKIDAYITDRSRETGESRFDVGFSRRELCTALGCAQGTAKRYLAELVAHEWLTVDSRSMTAPARYRVHFNAGEAERDRVCLDLIDVTELPGVGSSSACDAAWLQNLQAWLPRGYPVVTPQLPCGYQVENAGNPIKHGANGADGVQNDKTPHTGDFSRPGTVDENGDEDTGGSPIAERA